jgi:hypothetical protein
MTEGLDGERAVRKQAAERAAELADSYSDAGWDALALQPANVVPIPVGPDLGESRPEDADVGISFLLQNAEFSLVFDLIQEEFATEVFRGSHGEYTAAVVVLRDEEASQALTIPLSFHDPTAGAMATAARERGRVDLLVRPSDAEHRVDVSLDPAALLGDT